MQKTIFSLMKGIAKLSYNIVAATAKFTITEINNSIAKKQYREAIRSASSLSEPDRTTVLCGVINNWHTGNGEERFFDDIASAAASLTMPSRRNQLLILRKHCDKKKWWSKAKKIDALL